MNYLFTSVQIFALMFYEMYGKLFYGLRRKMWECMHISGMVSPFGIFCHSITWINQRISNNYKNEKEILHLRLPQNSVKFRSPVVNRCQFWSIHPWNWYFFLSNLESLFHYIQQVTGQINAFWQTSSGGGGHYCEWLQ